MPRRTPISGLAHRGTARNRVTRIPPRRASAVSTRVSDARVYTTCTPRGLPLLRPDRAPSRSGALEPVVEAPRRSERDHGREAGTLVEEAPASVRIEIRLMELREVERHRLSSRLVRADGRFLGEVARDACAAPDTSYRVNLNRLGAMVKALDID